MAGCFFVLLWIFMDYSQAFSAAPKKWNSDGVAITAAAYTQVGAVAATDQAMGAILVWIDLRDENRFSDIYGQRVDNTGKMVWQENGIPLIRANNLRGEPAAHGSPSIAPDGMGGAIFTWTDNRSLQGDVYAQRIDGSGKIKWQVNGVPVCTACWPGKDCNNSKHDPQIIGDGAGGGIITWYEMREGLHFSIWAQRVNGSGEVLWQANGIPIAYGVFDADSPKIVANGNGGAIIVWQDNRNEVCHYYAQQVDANGVCLWPKNGVEIFSVIAHGDPLGFSICADGYGGVVVSWTDSRKGDSSETDIYAQRLNSKGQTQWTDNGIPICTRQKHQSSPALSVDQTGGAFMVWEDGGASPEGSGEQWIYAQHVTGTGQILWELDGKAIHQHHSHNPKIISDGGKGAIVVWDSVEIIDPGTHKPTILSQHLTGSGRMLWPVGGFVVYSQIGNYLFGPQIISDGVGGAIVHWTDYRNPGPFWDIYAQRIFSEPVQYTVLPWMPLLLGD